MLYGEIDLRMQAGLEEKKRFYTGMLLWEKYVTQKKEEINKNNPNFLWVNNHCKIL